MTYRLVFANNPRVSPCPNSTYPTREWADGAAAYWQERTGEDMLVVEDRPVQAEGEGAK